MAQFLQIDKNQILEEESDKNSSNSQSRFESASMRPLDTLSNHSFGPNNILMSAKMLKNER